MSAGNVGHVVQSLIIMRSRTVSHMGRFPLDLWSYRLLVKAPFKINMFKQLMVSGEYKNLLQDISH